MEMTKERLEEYRSKKAEIQELQYRLNHLGEGDSLIGNDVIMDYRLFPKTTNTVSIVRTYYPRGDSMDKDKQEKLNQKKSNEKFNSITQKVKPENQNQTHNVRSEAVEPKNRQV